MKQKTGIIIVSIGAVIILILLSILAFVKPPQGSDLPKSFKGPTSLPHVKGPTEPPPQTFEISK